MNEHAIKTSKKDLKCGATQVQFHSFFYNLYSQEFGKFLVVIELIQLIYA